MDLGAEGLAHLSPTHIGNGMQSQTVEELIMVQQIFANTVHDKMQQLVLLVEEERHGKIANLLLGVLLRRDEVDGLEMAKVYIPTQNVNVKELADIFLLVVAAEVAVLELLSNIGQLFVDSLLF